MRVAIIANGKVTNVAEADPELAAGMGWPEIPASFGIDDLYSKGQFSKPSPRTLTLAERSEQLIPRLGQRWDAEEKGGTSALGWTVRTDAEGQAKITGGIVAFTNDPTLGSVPYELTPGVWLDLDEPTMCALGVVVAQHVKACAARARVISEAIQAASTPAAMDAVEAEIEVRWPE
ncbi:DUF4376 domain-containing protein [Devosia sp. 1635]|uniref:DUF4376 domain-containing protein n=1 Tax=Devosia sp. 1635 TaxID=2726066 RepID=UPI0015652B63|nr:DUF4376 domain-containing protein [Devosia sp. 1635]